MLLKVSFHYTHLQFCHRKLQHALHCVSFWGFQKSQGEVSSEGIFSYMQRRWKCSGGIMEEKMMLGMLPSNWMRKTWDLFQAGCERNLYLPKLMIFVSSLLESHVFPSSLKAASLASFFSRKTTTALPPPCMSTY